MGADVRRGAHRNQAYTSLVRHDFKKLGGVAQEVTGPPVCANPLAKPFQLTPLPPSSAVGQDPCTKIEGS